MAHLEQLYSDFINESARLLVDAVQHSLENPVTGLVRLYALLSRIRLGSSTEVIQSGERVIATILKTYFEPNLTPGEIQGAANKHSDHLQEFSETCRRELESLGEAILTTHGLPSSWLAAAATRSDGPRPATSRSARTPFIPHLWDSCPTS